MKNPVKWKLLRPVTILIFIAILNLYFFENYNNPMWQYIAISCLWFFFVWFAWDVMAFWNREMRFHYPHISQTFKRLVFTFAGYVAIELITQAVFLLVGNLLGCDWIVVEIGPFLTFLFLRLICVFAIGALYELDYSLGQYRITLQESEAAKNQTLQNQFDSLKNQINPHFLFNSLNSLSSLIEEDRTLAGQFLDELSSVYRYLLQSNENGLVSLKNELDFITSYLFLLKTRYASALDVSVIVDEGCADKLLPPQTLQILVENAIKHNVIMKQHPLKITIVTSPDGYVAVSNSILHKKVKVNSGAAGLAAAINRFQELNLGNLVIIDDGQLFTVKIPLLSKRAY